MFFPTVPGGGAGHESGFSKVISEVALINVSSASRSMRLTSSSHVGISWMRPITWPAVHTYLNVSTRDQTRC